MKTFPVVVLALCALGFFAFGVWLLADPLTALGKIGIAPSSATGVIELRAFYGGMELGLAAFLAMCAFKPEWRQAGLWLVLFSNGGAGLARLLGIALAGEFGSYLGWALVWELGFSALAGLALFNRAS